MTVPVGDGRSLFPRVDILRIDAGPDAGRWIALGADPLVVGRAPGPGRIADPSLEPHHLTVRAGAGEVVQLAGRVPARADGLPMGGCAAIRDGSVIEVGASRLVVATAHHSVVPCRGPGRVLLGVGPDDPVGVPGPILPFAPVTIDLATTRRILLAGPSAAGLLRAVLAQAPGRVAVRCRPSDLRLRRGDDRVLVAVDPDLDAGWSGGELPGDAAVVSVGSSWAATLMTRTPHSAASVRRFHAAGRPAGAVMVGPVVRR